MRIVRSIATFCLLLCTCVAYSGEPKLPKGGLRVPMIRQATDFSCGPAALQAVLIYWKVFDSYETSLYKMLKTTKKNGTSAQWLAYGAEQFGLQAKYLTNMTLDDLKKALHHRYTVILNIQAWREDTDTPWKDRWDDGHFVVLVGMDDEYIYVMDPSISGAYGFIPIGEFLERWHDEIEV